MGAQCSVQKAQVEIMEEELKLERDMKIRGLEDCCQQLQDLATLAQVLAPHPQANGLKTQVSELSATVKEVVDDPNPEPVSGVYHAIRQLRYVLKGLEQRSVLRLSANLVPTTVRT